MASSTCDTCSSTEDDLISCASDHKICHECFANSIKSEKLNCHICESKYLLLSIKSEDLLELFMKKDKEIEVKNTLIEHEKQLKKEEKISEVDKFIHKIEDILCPKCPNCRKVFYDNDGCRVVKCNKCNCAFCAFCCEYYSVATQQQEVGLTTASTVVDANNTDTTTATNKQQEQEQNCTCYILTLPDDTIHTIYCYLPASDLGNISSTCKHLNHMLRTARTIYVATRLLRPPPLQLQVQPNSKQQPKSIYHQINLCSTKQQVQELITRSIVAGQGDATGRVATTTTKGNLNKNNHNEFVSYARFLEETMCGYSHLQRRKKTTNNKIMKKEQEPILHYLPNHVQGRMASCSPEHSICRVGGDGRYSGGGGSGVASWGIGKRGQLGHTITRSNSDERKDVRHPQRIIGMHPNDVQQPNRQQQHERNNSFVHPSSPLGYGTRIVQVAAGGGLVRIAHTLLLTSTGRILSFGAGQYGALGHGYSGAKQLPDVIIPTYINGPLQNIICICIAAGELHSATVTSDGDVYTWGDGFCGQLGHGDKRPQVVPKQIVNNKSELPNEMVVNITCGCRHTIAVTEDGEVYSWGLGRYGVLGRSYTPFDYDHEPIDDNDDTNNMDHNSVPLDPNHNLIGLPSTPPIVRNNNPSNNSDPIANA